jgi:hypothetical protein
MSYIGNGPEVNYHTLGIERFSGDNTTVAFALTRDVDDSLAIEVHVNNVQQEPTYAYSANNGVITFTEAPSVGSNNITVLYRDTTQVIYNTVSTTQIDAGAVTASKLADGAVVAAISPGTITGNLIASQTIQANQIAPGTITGNLIATTAIRANQIADGSLTGDKITAGTLTGNLIGVGAINGSNHIAAGTITGDKITLSSVNGNVLIANTITGDKIGQGAISANNLAPGAIGSSIYSNIAYYTQPTSNLMPAQFTFTVPASTTRMKVTLVGGGGGSGSSVTGPPFNTTLGTGGGGGGGTTTAYLAGPFPGSAIDITVGGGGERGVATPSAAPGGTDGGTTVFGPFSYGANTTTIRAYGGGASTGLYLGPAINGLTNWGQGANTWATGQTVGGDYTVFYGSGYPGSATARFNSSIITHGSGLHSVGFSQFGGGKGQGALGVVNSGGALPGANGTPGMVMIEY